MEIVETVITIRPWRSS